MKKYIFIATFFALVVFSACEKLDRDFDTILNINQLQQSFGNVQALLTGLYSFVPDGTLYIDNAMMASATDEAEFASDGARIQTFNTGAWNAINNPDQVWGNYYKGIRQVNQFLVSTGQINLDQTKLDPTPNGVLLYNTNLATIKRWSYEARFLRAFFYFELVKRYGGVPLIDRALTLDEDFSKVQRNSLDSCIKYIVSECDSSAVQLPLNANTAPYVAATDMGRATKLAALALKSRVLLYAASDLFNTTSWAAGFAKVELISLPAGDRNARWKAASDAAKAVIDAAGLPTLGLYRAVFNNYNTITLPEIIFARDNSSSANSNTFERINSPIGYPQAQPGNNPSQDLVDAYEVKTSATTSVKFDWSDPAMAADPYSTKLPLQRDPRLDATIIRNDTLFGTPSRKVQIFVGGLDGKPIINASKTGYYLRKYQLESLNINSGNTGAHSWILFRYPEIYLNYAEALNEWSPGNVDIKNYYDRVRSRTGVAMPGLPTTFNQLQVKDAIRNERRVELAFEDHRFWDVRRWMLGVKYFNAPLRGVDITRTSITPAAYTYAPMVVENRVFTSNMYLYPIPQSDITLSTSLVQNPGW